MSVRSRHYWRFVPRFSLRTLILLVTFVGVACGVLRFIWNQYAEVSHEEAAILDRLSPLQWSCSVEYCEVGPQWLRSLVPNEQRGIFSRIVSLDANSLALDEHIDDLVRLRHLRKIRFYKCTGVDAAIGQLSAVEQLEELIVTESGLSDQGMRSMRSLEALKHLSLSETEEVTNLGYAQLEHVPTLESLKLSNVNIRDSALRVLPHITCLRKLTIASDTMTDSGLETILSLKNLETLTIEAGQIRHVYAARMPHLRSLWINRDGIETLTLEHLPSLETLAWNGSESLQRVVLDDVPRLRCFMSFVSPLVHMRLRNVPSLETVRLWECEVPELEVEGRVGVRCLELVASPASDDDVGRLKVLPNLEALLLDGTQITNAGLPHLKHFKRLRILTLRGTAVTDEGLAELVELQRLEQVSLGLSQVTESGIQWFQSQRPEVLVLYQNEPDEWVANSAGTVVPVEPSTEPHEGRDDLDDPWADLELDF